MDDMVDVEVNLLFAAGTVWMAYHHYVPIREAQEGFAEYMGPPHLPSLVGACDRWKMTHEQERRMRLLLGPHAHTIIKAYYARKQDDIPNRLHADR